jgi:hypothetical protein
MVNEQKRDYAIVTEVVVVVGGGAVGDDDMMTVLTMTMVTTTKRAADSVTQYVHVSLFSSKEQEADGLRPNATQRTSRCQQRGRSSLAEASQ